MCIGICICIAVALTLASGCICIWVCICIEFISHLHLHLQRIAFASHLHRICICTACVIVSKAICMWIEYAFAFASQVHLQLFLRLQLHCIWLCTCIQGCLHLHCFFFMCVYTCICLCICVYACIAFALLLLCICICARIGQATKASCNGLQNDASQHIGMPDCKSKRVSNFLHHSLIMSRGFKKSRQAASQHVALTPKFVFVGRLRPPLTRLGYAFHAQPFWLGSHWYNCNLKNCRYCRYCP